MPAMPSKPVIPLMPWVPWMLLVPVMPFDAFVQEMKVKGQAYPSALGRRPSKGRLSWSDDFGGCLAEYYEVL